MADPIPSADSGAAQPAANGSGGEPLYTGPFWRTPEGKQLKGHFEGLTVAVGRELHRIEKRLDAKPLELFDGTVHNVNNKRPWEQGGKGGNVSLQEAFDRGFEMAKAYIDAEIGDLKKNIAEIKARPTMKYRGVWAAEKVYSVGDFVTDHGSLWHCWDSNVGVRPGNSDTWQLAVQRGRDAKDKGAR